MANIPPELSLMIAEYLDLKDLLSFMWTSSYYRVSIELTLQKRVVAWGKHLVTACNQKKLTLALYLLSTKISAYTKLRDITHGLPENLILVIFRHTDGKQCLPGCEMGKSTILG